MNGREAEIQGRARECETLDEMLERVQRGQSAVLVLCGEAGIGKTALLRYCETRDPSVFAVVHLAGVESEMELPYAGLHRLCGRMLDQIGRLPEPQQRALQVALGLAAGDPPDRFLVALAALTLLAEAATERPLLCLVDDAQWLDGASAEVLGFVARRLLAESVALVFAVRDPDARRELDGVPRLPLEGLEVGEARALLATVIPGRIDERVRDRIVAETRGNPLALLELPRGRSSAQLAGGFGLPVAPSLTSRIEASFLRRLDDVPDESRLLLLIAAAEPLGDPALLWGAAARLGIASTALEPAVRAELVEVGPQVRFRHPLVRSALYRAASDGERRRAHAALADATDAVRDPDRRVWHQAQATQGPDENVAVELVRSAGRAQARGGLGAAAAFLARAAELTGDAGVRSDRMLDAAQAHLQAGSFEAALTLLAAARGGDLGELGLARVALLEAQTAFAQNRGSEAPGLLLGAAGRLENLDPRMARDTYLDAWGAALFAGDLAGEGGTLLDVSRAALQAPRAPGAPRASDLLLDGFSLVFTDGRATATPVLEHATRAFAGDEVSPEEVLRWGWLATAAAVLIWDYDTCFTAAARGVELARQSGALEVLVVSLNVRGQTVALCGDFATAVLLIAEADEVKEATGTLVAPYGALVLGALRGREDEISPVIATTIREATLGGQGTAVQYARWADAVLKNSLGRYEEALAAAQEASRDTPELFVSMWSLSELVEAATRIGRTELAHDGVARLAEHTRASDADWARGMQARAEALVSEDETAEELYRQAVDCLGRTRLRPELARSRLLYGEWLRRAKRRSDAREQLRAAHEEFLSMGAEAFARRAGHELLATGAKVRRRVDETRDELTPQEENIARMARDGRTNPQIGQELFLSPRTVEWHLNKVFAKLGVGSRRELPEALDKLARDGARRVAAS